MTLCPTINHFLLFFEFTDNGFWPKKLFHNKRMKYIEMTNEMKIDWLPLLYNVHDPGKDY